MFHEFKTINTQTSLFRRYAEIDVTRHMFDTSGPQGQVFEDKETKTVFDIL